MRKYAFWVILMFESSTIFGMQQRADMSNRTADNPIMKAVKNNDLENAKQEIDKLYHKIWNSDAILPFLCAYKNKHRWSDEILHMHVDPLRKKLAKILDIRDTEKSTPLFAAVQKGNENIVKYLVEHGADVNEEIYGNTPLFAAVKKSNENIVKYLVEHDADVNHKNACGETSLFAAARRGNENIIKYLVEHGADVNEGIYGNTPLFAAVRKSNENIVKYLVDHGADVNHKNACGETSLFAAARTGNENIVKYLTEHGANINERDRWDKTPLHIAIDNKNEEIVKYLAECGAKREEQTANLDISAKSDSYSMLVCLRLYIVDN